MQRQNEQKKNRCNPLFRRKLNKIDKTKLLKKNPCKWEKVQTDMTIKPQSCIFAN